MIDSSEGKTYQDPCPKCGTRMIGVSKSEYIAHLRANSETLAAKIEDEMVADVEAMLDG